MDYLDYKWKTATATMPDGTTYDFIVEKVVDSTDWVMLQLKITSGKNKGKYSIIADYEIDDTIHFNI